MEQLIRLGCPIPLDQSWQVIAFLALPCVLAALGARLFQGSFLRIIGAALGGVTRDSAIALWVFMGHPTANPDYNFLASLLLIYLTGSGAALGACFGPYRGPVMWILAGLGVLAGQWLFGYLAPILLVLLVWRYRTRNSPGLPC